MIGDYLYMATRAGVSMRLLLPSTADKGTA